MDLDYQHVAKTIITLIGGNENIVNVSHCATRLRFVLHDNSRVDKAALSRTMGVITVVESSGQMQVVIGNHVGEVYKQLIELQEKKSTTPSRNSTPYVAPKMGIMSRIIDVISSVFAPFLYPLAACGILQGLISLFAALGWFDPQSGAYRILDFISWTAFTFLPVLVAITAAKKFNVNQFSAVIAACALISPSYMNMITAHNIASINSGDPNIQALMQAALTNPDIKQSLIQLVGVPLHAPSLDFFGIPIQFLAYTSSVIPIILMVWMMSYVQRFFDRILPSVVRNLFTPLFCLAIIVPATLLLFGPAGNLLGQGLGTIYNTLYSASPIIAGLVVGAAWQPLVTLGVHWGITPVVLNNLATLGYDTFTALQASSVFAMAGTAFGVFLKTRSGELKKASLSAGITALFGITEPVLYGVALRLKKPFICACIAGSIGSGVAGFFHAVTWSYIFPGIAVLPAYYKIGHLTPFLGLILSIIIAFVLSAVLTYVVGFDDNKIVKEGNT